MLGYRGGGLILGLGTQGQLHGNIACGQGGEWVNVRREDLPEFWRIGREALSLRDSLQIARVRTANRAYFESEVACPVMPAVGNAPVRYPESIVGEARTSGGRRVRQRVHMAIVVRPPEADASVLVSKLVVSDSTNRTIFFRRPK